MIEHFWEGYDEILKEIKRVLKPNGYLFLSFPYISPLRKFKANLGFYKIFNNRLKNDNFYQFILDEKRVKDNIKKYEFIFVSRYPFDATKGLKDELFLLKPILQKIYDDKSIVSKGIRVLNSILFSKFACHSILLVFKKL